MPNYVLAQESSRANIPDRLWYAMEETDLEDIAANENIATGDKVYVIKQGKTYIFGEDSEWYVSGKSSGGGGTSVDVEPLAVNANGTYTAAEGTAYSPVTVDVPQTNVRSLSVTENGTYTAPEGAAYSPVTVNAKYRTAAVTISNQTSTGMTVTGSYYANLNSRGTIFSGRNYTANQTASIYLILPETEGGGTYITLKPPSSSVYAQFRVVSGDATLDSSTTVLVKGTCSLRITT